jgi:hypothetical protein
MAALARVAELVDAHDSKCYHNAFYCCFISKIDINILLHMSYTKDDFSEEFPL